MSNATSKPADALAWARAQAEAHTTELIARGRSMGLSEAEILVGISGAREVGGAITAVAKEEARGTDARALALFMVEATRQLLESGWRVADVVGPDVIHQLRKKMDAEAREGGDL